MATGRTFQAVDSRQPSHWKRNSAALLALALIAAFLFARGGLRQEALAATAFGARTGCVCRYISGRPLDDCKGDLKAANLGHLSALVMFSQDDANHTVKASVPLLVSQTASFAPDTGCQLQTWED